MKVLVLGTPKKTSKMYLEYLKPDVEVVYKDISELQGTKPDVVIIDELVIEVSDDV